MKSNLLTLSRLPSLIPRPGNRGRIASTSALMLFALMTKDPDMRLVNTRLFPEGKAMFVSGERTEDGFAPSPLHHTPPTGHVPVTTTSPHADIVAVFEKEPEQDDRIGEEVTGVGGGDPDDEGSQDIQKIGGEEVVVEQLADEGTLPVAIENSPEITNHQATIYVEGKQYNFSVGTCQELHGGKITLGTGDKDYKIKIGENRISSLGVLNNDAGNSHVSSLLLLIKQHKTLRAAKNGISFDGSGFDALIDLAKQGYITGFRYTSNGGIEALEIDPTESFTAKEILKKLPPTVRTKVKVVYALGVKKKDLKELLPNLERVE